MSLKHFESPQDDDLYHNAARALSLLDFHTAPGQGTSAFHHAKPETKKHVDLLDGLALLLVSKEKTDVAATGADPLEIVPQVASFCHRKIVARRKKLASIYRLCPAADGADYSRDYQDNHDYGLLERNLRDMGNLHPKVQSGSHVLNTNNLFTPTTKTHSKHYFV